MPQPRQRLFVLNDPHALRISAALAVEIGLNESIVLLQLEYLLSISEHSHEGRVWTYQSLADLKANHFPFWSRATIMRTVKSLRARQLIAIGNFNRAGYDKTSWYALETAGLATLASVRLVGMGSETGVFQNETPASALAQIEPGLFHDEPSVVHFETTIPESTSETTPKKTGPRARTISDVWSYAAEAAAREAGPEALADLLAARQQVLRSRRAGT